MDFVIETFSRGCVGFFFYGSNTAPIQFISLLGGNSKFQDVFKKIRLQTLVRLLRVVIKKKNWLVSVNGEQDYYCYINGNKKQKSYERVANEWCCCKVDKETDSHIDRGNRGRCCIRQARDKDTLMQQGACTISFQVYMGRYICNDNQTNMQYNFYLIVYP